ncbi:hypothetical protein M434DRAFT_32431 [Hypoxylon sp. CO27-5]|nr:hypothetical protein M434DRAFT_32431 [Hypoxylon sp. CO27-5]
MATAVMASAPQSDLEKGLEPHANRTTSYIRDITYRVIPFCMAVLIIFSIGIVIVSTLHFDQPIPHQGTYVISILLAVLFFLFCIGVAYLYKKRHYPPLTKGPDAPDRPHGKGKLKNSIAMASTLFVNTLKVDKLSRHHKMEPDVNFQDIPNNPAELPSPDPMDAQSRSSQQPHGPQATGQPSGITSDQARQNHGGESNSGSRPPLTRKQVPRHHVETKQRGSPLRRSFTPSQDDIPEEPEENERVYSLSSNRSATYMPYSPRPSTVNNTRPARKYRETVGPMSQSPASPQKTGLRHRPPTFQMTGANGNSQVNHQEARYPTTPPNPQVTVTVGTTDIPSLRPDPTPVRLSLDSADPLANLVQIPENINEQVFVEALPGKHAKNGLYIFNNLPSLPNYELEAARFGGECYCYEEKPRGRTRERKIETTQPYTDNTPKRPPTHDSGYSEGVVSSVKSSLTRPAPVLYSQETTAKNCGMAISTHGVQNCGNARHRHQGVDSSSASHRPHTERKHHKPSRKERTTSRQKRSQPSAPDSPDMFFNLPIPKLPSRPPRTKPPSRKDPEEADWELVDLKARNSHKIKTGTKEKPPNSKRDMQQLARDRSRAAEVDTTSAIEDKQKLSMYNVRGRHPNQMPMTVLPRCISSRFHEHIAASRRATPESDTSVSKD